MSLNEVILEEAFGAKTCTYHLKIDDKILFSTIKSSGIIVATGSGSTGLLMSARRTRMSELKHLIGKSQDSLLSELKDMQERLRFEGSDTQFYYFNRELYLNNQQSIQYAKNSFEDFCQMQEGYCQKLTIDNLNLDGNILIDGNQKLKLEYGDVIDINIGNYLK